MARAKPPPRQRRSPAEARALILGATQQLLAARGPDAIGLKDVAAEAGVSHALVSHYFGTVASLVEEALHEHMLTLRAESQARILASNGGDLRGWVDLAFEHATHPLSGRLLAWALLGGHLDREDFFVRRDRGFGIIASALEARARMLVPDEEVRRGDVEVGAIVVFASALGYGIARDIVWESLGKEPSPERDEAVREALTRMLAAWSPAARALAGPDDGATKAKTKTKTKIKIKTERDGASSKTKTKTKTKR